jgi:hypothetical protein
LHAELARHGVEALADGHPIFDELPQAMERAAEASANRIVPVLLNTTRRAAAREARWWRRYSRSLRKPWGRTFDLYACYVRGCEEICEELLEDETESRDDLTLAVVGQLALLAMRAGWEVHRLITAGLPEGAGARARTIHEVVVIVTLLLEDETGTLVERFDDHRVIRQLHWAEQLTRLTADGRLSADRALDPDQLTFLRLERDRLIGKHGRRFDSLYGWATPLTRDPTFERLEHLAGFGHMRPTYAENSLPVHPQSWALDLALVDGVAVSRGRHVHLAEPITAATVSMMHMVTALLAALPHDPSPADAMYMKVLMKLSAETQAAAIAATEDTAIGE